MHDCSSREEQHRGGHKQRRPTWGDAQVVAKGGAKRLAAGSTKARPRLPSNATKGAKALFHVANANDYGELAQCDIGADARVTCNRAFAILLPRERGEVPHENDAKLGGVGFGRGHVDVVVYV